MFSSLRYRLPFLHLVLAFFCCSAFVFMPASSLFARSYSKDMRCDIVVFSFDRALQLFAFLESCEKYLTNVGHIHVIYRTSNQEHQATYEEVSRRFPSAQFHRQSALPQNDFKSLVWAAVYSNTSTASYMMFAVDDMIVTDYVNLEACTNAIEDYEANGFFLRLGKNITHCFMLNRATPVPEGKDVGANKEFFVWKIKDGDGDWGYPNNTDMTIYRKKSLRDFLRNASYITPNSLESTWQKWREKKAKGICFQASKNINIPMNLVNPSNNRANHTYTVQQLLDLFKSGKKIDIMTFYKVANSSPHVDYMPAFINR